MVLAPAPTIKRVPHSDSLRGGTPLSEDEEASLDLQSLLHRVYDAARYRIYIYRGEPEFALPETDRTWAATLVSSI